jgi:putative transposase
VPKGLKRYYGQKHLHFITCSCYRRRPGLGTGPRRNLFLRVLEQVRERYRFDVVGYVVMPEHFHLLMSEPEQGDPSLVMQVLKQRVARQAHRRRRRRRAQPELFALTPGEAPFWQRRFYDFNVWSKRKRVEKLRYMHRNPVARGLVPSPELWAWSSFRFYAYGEAGLVKIDPW